MNPAKPQIVQNSETKSSINRGFKVDEEKARIDTDLKYAFTNGKKESAVKLTYRLSTYSTPKVKKEKTHLLDTSYTRDYFGYLRMKEEDSIVWGDFLSRQTQVKEASRLILIDWLVEAQKVVKFSGNTLFLCVLFIDKFLAKHVIAKSEFHLIGIAALSIASKIEDLQVKSLTYEYLVNLAGGCHTTEQLVFVEAEILKENIFKIGFVTLYTYVDKLSGLMKSDSNRDIFTYMMTCTLYNYKMRTYRPSIIVQCVLDYLVSSTSKQIQRNLDFETVLEYLDVKVVNHREYSECMEAFLTTMKMTEGNHYPGLVKARPKGDSSRNRSK